ncbi:hypothetical protein BU24DRAFT_423267 [Aaosphaeria arxii CBS 175.79]|uniref:Zn(2)-C6 fungal-type domain-containing protein n=1 Tax=Aaosphaeria arxii CBS 175.79 TaxID=1450172 RepID=A0A6A5XM92_9PLEO|nr:uncharacterized protein BU24DRAFT_423267 [Aaosphaeria arxii CBS 175.79]KAF2014262.1 hypothetical protein BU24DRAFT_423267 [Aaosphaeria arxii CBS 175.79]
MAAPDERSNDDDARNPSPRPRKKQRKQRPCYSCDECRRLKMKCDRQVPCSNCVRRNRSEMCNRVATDRRAPFRGSDPQSRRQHGTGDSSLPTALEDRSRNTEMLAESHPNQDSQQQLLHPAESSGGQSLTPVPLCHNDRDNHGSSNLLSRAIEPYNGQEQPSQISPPVHTYVYSIPTGASGSSHPGQQSVDDEQDGSHGTLMLSKGGRSKYLGPTAGSEWLKDSETQDIHDSPLNTRAPSPVIPEVSVHPQPGGIGLSAFPFHASTAYISTHDVLSRLPPKDEAWTLAEAYYRYCAWHHDVAPKDRFEKTFERVYSLASGSAVIPPVDPQEIALVFIIMAQGTRFNIEMPINDPSADEWLHLSEQALVKGNFLSNNTVAGLQTLHLMAHWHLQLDKGRRGDIAWPLWGLVMRLIQAMGMHRDGARWNLPEDVVEERRKVFWECNAADTFQAHCFSRPCAINPEHCDTAFPSEPLNSSGEKSYYLHRFELSQHSAEILNMAMKVRKPPYSDVLDLDSRLCEFERSLPFSLRSRAAYLAMPSRYPQLAAAIEASPEPSLRSMAHSFQQMNLAINISETFMNLHRPYYAKALYDEEGDGSRSIYAPSFLTVIERCAMIISLVMDIHKRFPAVSLRQWNLWYHVFGSALCLGTLLLRDPTNAMSAFVLSQIDAAVDLFTSLIQHGAGSPRYNRNLEWLTKLRARASSKMASSSQVAAVQSNHDENQRRGDGDVDDNEDVELLGWRTRLIERAGQESPSVKTIHLPSTPNAVNSLNRHHTSDQSEPRGPPGQMRATETLLGSANPAAIVHSTDDLLHEFWDPMLLQDIFGNLQDQPNLSINSGSAWWASDTSGLDVASWPQDDRQAEH